MAANPDSPSVGITISATNVRSSHRRNSITFSGVVTANYVAVVCNGEVGEPGMVDLDTRQPPGRLVEGPAGQDRPLGNGDSLALSGMESNLGECDGCGLLFIRRFGMSRSILSISQPLHDLLASGRLCLVKRGLAALVPYARIRTRPEEFLDRFEFPPPCAEMQRGAALLSFTSGFAPRARSNRTTS